MKANEPSRTTLMVASQRLTHQVADHGSILCDPFAMKILPEDVKNVLQFAKEHPLAGIARRFSARSEPKSVQRLRIILPRLSNWSLGSHSASRCLHSRLLYL
ncbi:MAG TPA: hypothetical protein VGF88_02810 [Acidobacteriaceae bacterium]